MWAPKRASDAEGVGLAARQAKSVIESAIKYVLNPSPKKILSDNQITRRENQPFFTQEQCNAKQPAHC